MNLPSKKPCWNWVAALMVAGSLVGAPCSRAAEPFLRIVTPRKLLPSIQVQPSDRQPVEGGRVSLTATVPEGEPRTFEWFFSGRPIPEATSPGIEIVNLSRDDSGLYQVTVVFADGSRTSAATMIRVLPLSEASAPSIVRQPESQRVRPWTPVIFSIQATGPEPLRFHWFRDGKAMDGETNSWLSFASVEWSDVAMYRVDVTNDFGSVSSASCALEFVPASPPRFLEQPRSQTFALGGRGELLVEMQGSERLRYQWWHDGKPIADGDRRVLEVADIGPSDAGDYSVVVWNGYPSGVVTSQLARVIVAPPVPPTALSWPASGGIALRDELVLAPRVVGTPPLHYAWRKDGSPAGDSTVGPLRIAAAGARDSGEYTVVVSNPFGVISSPVIRIAVTNLTAPRIVEQPRSVEVVANSSLELRVRAEGAGPLEYLWFKNGEPLNRTLAELRLSSVQPEDSGGYAVLVSNRAGQAMSQSAVVVVTGGGPVRPGGTLRFSNRVTGVLDAPVLLGDGVTPVSGPLYVAQLYAGLSLESLAPVGARAPFRTGLGAGYWDPGSAEERTIASVPAGEPAWIQVRAWSLAAGESFEEAEANGGVSGRSAPIRVVTGGAGVPPTVSAVLDGLTSFILKGAPPPRIRVQPLGREIEIGSGLVLSVEAEGESLNYQWTLYGKPITGAVGAIYALPAITGADQGFYQVEVRGAGGRVLSDSVPVVVSSPRRLDLGVETSVVGGGRVWLPVHLETDGAARSGKVVLRHDPALLFHPQVEFRNVFGAGSGGWRVGEPGTIVLEFTASSEAMARGRHLVAMVGLRSRTVGAPVTTAVSVDVASFQDHSGQFRSTGTALHGTRVTVVPRAFPGDNNGNLRLDIGDLSAQVALTAGSEPVEPWDVVANDWNKDGGLTDADTVYALERHLGIRVAETLGPHAVARPGHPALDLRIVRAPEGKSRDFWVQIGLTNLHATPVTGVAFRLLYAPSQVRLSESDPVIVGNEAFKALWHAPSPLGAGHADVGVIRFAAASAAPIQVPLTNIAVIRFTTVPDMEVQASTYSLYARIESAECTGEDAQPWPAGGAVASTIGGPVDPPPPPVDPPPPANADRALELMADPNQSYLIEQSEDLLGWKPGGVMTTDSAGVAILKLSASTGQSALFLRARLIE